MSVILTRAESDVANVSNSDDIRAFKYASCGINGVIKNRLNQVGYEIGIGEFTVKSGEIVIDGWQVKIDANGTVIHLDNTTGIRYYSVYCEIDLSDTSAKVATIKSNYGTSTYPVIDKGDDISIIDNGVARLELYRFIANDRSISNVVQRFVFIDGIVDSARKDGDGNTISSTYVKNSVFNNSNTTAFGNYIIEKRVKVWEAPSTTTLSVSINSSASHPNSKTATIQMTLPENYNRLEFVFAGNVGGRVEGGAGGTRHVIFDLQKSSLANSYWLEMVWCDMSKVSDNSYSVTVYFDRRDRFTMPKSQGNLTTADTEGTYSFTYLSEIWAVI